MRCRNFGGIPDFNLETKKKIVLKIRRTTDDHRREFKSHKSCLLLLKKKNQIQIIERVRRHLLIHFAGREQYFCHYTIPKKLELLRCKFKKKYFFVV